MHEKLTRRGFLSEATLVAAAAATMRAVEGANGAEPAAKELPKIKLGTLEVSRLILGSNPFFGIAHQEGDAGEQMRRYYTDARIMAVLDEAAALGVTAVASPPYPRWIKLFAKYLEQGGKLRTWIAQPDPPPEMMKEAIAAAAKGGAKAIFIQGGRADAQFSGGGLGLLPEWIDYIKSFGVPAGMAAHGTDTHLAAEKAKLPTDFYYQCFFPPGSLSKEPGRRIADFEKAITRIVKEIDKPIVGYKILSAGRIPPKEGFSFALAHLRPRDGVCVGVFPRDKADMIAEDATLTRELTTSRSAQ